MAKRQAKFNHDNSPAKNVWLALRALFNVIAFFVLFYSLATGSAWYFTALGGVLVAVGAWINVIIPFFRRR